MTHSVKHFLLILLFLVWLLAFSIHLHAAAYDGYIGTHLSTGSVDIAIVIPPLVRVHGLSPITFDFNPGVTESKQIAFCISGNSSDVAYAAVLTTNEGDFVLSDGTGKKLPYHVEFDNTLSAKGSGDETYGAKIMIQDLNSQFSGCIEKNASLNIYVDSAELNGNMTGIYTDIMTVTVVAE